MLKKTANYFMSFVLLFSLMEISIHKHCTNRELSSILIYENNECCQNECNCCSEKNHSFKITDAFLKTTFKIKHITKHFKKQISRLKVIITKDKSAIIFSGFYKFPVYFNINTPALFQCFRL